MDLEVIFWTAFFFGGDLLAVIALLLWAVKKDREKARAGTAGGRDHTA
ncbi:hypothetical protein RxyAA322_26220 [Rubrobacter xylanophilus]|uniref:Uncharacterized protein n=1 Tax=Rubrobacter xylanophilus TaxID=49319 RepID=A0A510HLT6_9ACTN|nr:hypothetical protein [Rubrobacter xylanophilus]BBL80768.1 hypothetical protein RxyAA322_26220 [Rubrobacter xylanophilus]